MKSFTALSSLLALLALPLAAHAADYPDKPIKLVVPFAPGGNIDTTARNVATGLSEALGKPVIVENRAGAGGVIGSQYVARAAPDGYTCLLGSTGVTTNARSAVAPDLPTIAESGLPNFEASTSTGILCPAGTPSAVIGKLNGALVKTLQQAEVKKNLLSLGADVTPGTPQDFSNTLGNELAKWTKVVKEAGIKVE